MKAIKAILVLVGIAAGFALLLVVAAFSPVVQGWEARRLFERQELVHADWADLSAGPSGVDFTDLRLTHGEAVAQIPSVQAKLPVIAALRGSDFAIDSLTVKGWVLDLSKVKKAPAPEALPPPSAEAEAGQTQEAVATAAAPAFAGFMDGLLIPWTTSIGQIESDGEIVLAGSQGRAGTRIHVFLQGGPLRRGAEGKLTFEAKAVVADPTQPVSTATAKGELQVALGKDGRIERVRFAGPVNATGGAVPAGIGVNAQMAIEHNEAGEHTSIAISRADSTVVAVDAQFDRGRGSFAGSWKLGMSDSDLTPFRLETRPPFFQAAGEGIFEVAPGFTRARLVGRLKGKVGPLDAFDPRLAAMGVVGAQADFDFGWDPSTIRVGRLTVQMESGGPSLRISALRPFEFDWRNWKLAQTGPGGELLKAVFAGVPIQWLASPYSALEFGSASTSGSLVLSPKTDGFAFSTKEPLVVAPLHLTRHGRPFADFARVEAEISGTSLASGWKAHIRANARRGTGNERLTIDAEANQPSDPYHPLTVTGKWSGRPSEIVVQPALSGLSWLTGQAASGSFTATLGSATEVETKVRLEGTGNATGEKTWIEANVLANFGADGSLSFQAPSTLHHGSSETDISAEGTYTIDDRGPMLELGISLKNAFRDQLEEFLGPEFARMRDNLSLIRSSKSSEVGSSSAKGYAGAHNLSPSVPFWGNWRGHIRFNVDRLEDHGKAVVGIGGNLEVDPKYLRLSGARAAREPRGDLTGQGTLEFSAGAPDPYHLSGKATFGEVEAGPYFPAQPGEKDPTLEGRFAVEISADGIGSSLADCLEHASETLTLNSSTALWRGLAVNVADVIPESRTTMGDRLHTVGSAVGTFFSVDHNYETTGKNKVSKRAEAVLDFAGELSELVFDSFTVEATRSSDGAVRITRLTAQSPFVHLTGSGEIRAVQGSGFADAPMHLELKLGAKDRVSDFMTLAGLAAKSRDASGYTALESPFVLEGSLSHLNRAKWHDLLARAAVAPDPADSAKPVH